MLSAVLRLLLRAQLLQQHRGGQDREVGPLAGVDAQHHVLLLAVPRQHCGARASAQRCGCIVGQRHYLRDRTAGRRLEERASELRRGGQRGLAHLWKLEWHRRCQLGQPLLLRSRVQQGEGEERRDDQSHRAALEGRGSAHGTGEFVVALVVWRQDANLRAVLEERHGGELRNPRTQNSRSTTRA